MSFTFSNDVFAQRLIIAPQQQFVVRERRYFGRGVQRLSLAEKVAFWWLGTIGEQEEVYNLQDGQHLRDEVSAHMLMGAQTDAEEIEQIVADSLQSETVEAMPKLVASVVVGLRMKLGVGAMDRSVPGNVDVVRREIPRMLRSYNVRNKLAAAHLRLIEEAFFAEDSDRLVVDARARACRKSRFVRWLLGTQPVGYNW